MGRGEIKGGAHALERERESERARESESESEGEGEGERASERERARDLRCLSREISFSLDANLCTET